MDTGFESIAFGPALFYMGGELDAAVRHVAEDALNEAAKDGGLITVDMSNVTFMDSTGLRILLHTLGQMPSGCIVLHGVRPAVRMVLEVSGVDRHERLHVLPCGEDPFPAGNRIGRGVGEATLARVQDMKLRHQRLQARTDGMRRWTQRLTEASERTRASSRERRDAVRRDKPLAA